MTNIGHRKEDHLELCATGEVGFAQTSTLFDDVLLLHDALPELGLDDIDLRCTLLGKELQAPLLIGAMTGGTDRAATINQELAQVAEVNGIGFALGSQRPMLEDPTTTPSYAVRNVAPTTLVLGNLGLCQARGAGLRAVEALAQAVGADGMAIHLNPAQELVQPGGDRDFRGGLELLKTLQAGLSVPLLVKETGCGLGPVTVKKLYQTGIRHVDMAGAGGTSWVAVERLRAQGTRRHLGDLLGEWGIPTAATVVVGASLGFETLIASGGVRHGLDAARALALGASAVSVARPVLQAYWQSGVSGAEEFISHFIEGLRAVMLLTGAKNLEELRRVPRLLQPRLLQWIQTFGSSTPVA